MSQTADISQFSHSMAPIRASQFRALATAAVVLLFCAAAISLLQIAGPGAQAMTAADGMLVAGSI